MTDKEALDLALEALAPLEKLFMQADEQGLLTGANVDCQIATNDLRKSAYAASDIRTHLNTPPAAPVQNRSALTLDRPMTFGGCPFCGSQSCIAGQCKLNTTPLPAQPAPVPKGMVLLPKRMTQAMRDVTDTEDWTWEDLLSAAEAITEDEYNELAAQPPAAPVPLTDEQKLMCWSKATHDADVEHKTEHQCLMDYGSEIEAAHGITEKGNT